jgi:hypothetical protein
MIDLLVRKMFLDRPQCLIDVSHCLDIIDSVSPQHPQPVVAFFGFDLLFIDNKVAAYLICMISDIMQSILVPVALKFGTL